MYYFTDRQVAASLDGADRPDTAPAGLTAAADRAARRRPDGVSAREGVLVVAMAALLGVMLAVGYQAPAMARGVLVAGVAGYVWQSGLVDVVAPVWLTTAVAGVAVLPTVLVGVGLVRAAR